MAALPRDGVSLRLEVLREAFDRFGSARDRAGAASAATSMVQTAVGQDAGVAFWQPDAAGRLRVVRHDGDGSATMRGGSERRRIAFRALRSSLLVLPDTDDRAVGTISVAHGRSAFGVLEVVATHAAIAPAWTTLELMSSQLALTLRNLAERARRRDEEETFERLSRLGVELVRL